MSPRLRRNWGGSRGTLRTLVYLATYRAFERIDELACVVALLARSPLENSSPVHPATSRPWIPFWILKGTLASGFSSDGLSPRCNRAPARQAGGTGLQVPFGKAT